MKKAVTFMMALTMMAFMTACGSNGDAEESNAQTAEIIESTVLPGRRIRSCI